WDKSVRFAIARACGCEGEVPQGLREDVDERDGAGSVRFGVIVSDESRTPPRSLVFQKGVRPLLIHSSRPSSGFHRGTRTCSDSRWADLQPTLLLPVLRRA